MEVTEEEFERPSASQCCFLVGCEVFLVGFFGWLVMFFWVKFFKEHPVVEGFSFFFFWGGNQNHD